MTPLDRTDTLLFADDAPAPTVPTAPDPWKILIVDDEAEVHDVTRLVLSGFQFKGRGLCFLDAFTGGEARQLLAQHPDIALILLDVVMEENDTGLALVKYIREELGNRFVRIILRTGQPGQAPEERVIVEYDINDYKEKTELTAQKLVTTVVAALRTCMTLWEKPRFFLSSRVMDRRWVFRFSNSGAKCPTMRAVKSFWAMDWV